ncbi:MAG TPA: nitrilase-related carbon-nitrogen hydrolase [bacterium]|nr:nitrilase-related carbon-nitrogen hydrolase [bacterium]HPN30542.1 nitrilase-related carbon-nitrogen hydrolase [bacterium]
MKLNCGLVQYNIEWENKEKNKSRIKSLVENYFSKLRTDWLVFPEFCLSGFSLDRTKSEIGEDDIYFFSELARKFETNISYGAVIDGFNKMITLNKSGIMISEYSKIHLFSSGDEHLYYNAGKKQQPFMINEFRIDPAICYDLRFSYLFWNNALDSDVFVVIANWPSLRRNHWLTLLKARSIENQCYAIGVNRTGVSPNNSYCGDSIIIDPFGNEILNCGEAEGIFTAAIEKSKLLETREKFQVLKDRKKI